MAFWFTETIDFISLSNENEFLYTTLNFWFFEILKSYNNALLLIVLRKDLLFSFAEI